MTLDDIEFYKHIKKTLVVTIVTIYGIFCQILVVASMFFGVWILKLIARLLNMESNYFIQIINQVSGIGLTIMFIIMAISAVRQTCNLYKD